MNFFPGLVKRWCEEEAGSFQFFEPSCSFCTIRLPYTIALLENDSQFQILLKTVVVKISIRVYMEML